MEEWKQIVLDRKTKYLYYVSNIGNFKRVFVNTEGVIEKEYVVARNYNKKSGYYNVSISGKKHYVHRLVAQYFCKGYKENLEVNHIDGDKGNNRSDNLEWCTKKENMLHASRNNLINVTSEKRKEQCKLNAKNSYLINSKPIVCLTYDLVFISRYDSIAQASLLTNISNTNIQRAVNNPRYGAGGYRWYSEEDYINGTIDTTPIKEYSKKVVRLTRDFELLEEYVSVNKATEYCKETLNKTGDIFRALKEKGGVSLGYRWMYKTDYDKIKK